MPSQGRRRAQQRGARLLAAVLVVQLATSVGSAVFLERRQPPAAAPGPASTAAGRPAPSDRVDSRTAAVRALLDARAAAVRAKDPKAFLATVAPGATAFRKAQASLIAALKDVPLGSWAYELDPGSEQARDPALDRRYGTGWWAPDVTLTYALKGYDRLPTFQAQYLTFVQRSGRWYVASDSDFDAIGLESGRGLWDGGPVVVVQGRSSLVLGHPKSRDLLRTLADATDAAVPRVSRVWGEDWSRKVVLLVPDSQAELAVLLDATGDLSQIAAVATAELRDEAGGFVPVGERMIVNPPNFSKLGPVGRRIVLTHEVTHVATRAATSPGAPTWLVEGIADYVGYLDVDVPIDVAARELRAALRAGKGPKGLPADEAFEGDNSKLAETYEQAWLAVRALVDRYGEQRMLDFYRAAGQQGADVDRAFQQVLKTDVRAFTAAWLASLQRRLA